MYIYQHMYDTMSFSEQRLEPLRKICPRFVQPGPEIYTRCLWTTLRCDHVIEKRDAEKNAEEHSPWIWWGCELHAEERGGEEEWEGDVL